MDVEPLPQDDLAEVRDMRRQVLDTLAGAACDVASLREHVTGDPNDPTSCPPITDPEALKQAKEVCNHCGKPPTGTSRFWNWFSVRIGPSAAWHHHYCSEACFEHADEYSSAAWKALHSR